MEPGDQVEAAAKVPEGDTMRTREDEGRQGETNWKRRPYCFPTKSSFGEGGPGVEVNSHRGSGSTGRWSQSGARRGPWRHRELGRGPSREVGCLGRDPCSATWSFCPSEVSFTFLHPISSFVKWKSLPMECGEG